jgi:hypothetical protein
MCYPAVGASVGSNNVEKAVIGCGGRSVVPTTRRMVFPEAVVSTSLGDAAAVDLFTQVTSPTI